MTTTPNQGGTLAWIKPGASAVILTLSRWTSPTIKPVTIDRVLKRDVVLSDGQRFRLNNTNGDRLIARDGDAWSTSTTYLTQPGDPKVTEARHTVNHDRLKSRAQSAFEDWRRDKATAAAVAAAFHALADFENQEKS